jgi:hypothetical protein
VRRTHTSAARDTQAGMPATHASQHAPPPHRLGVDLARRAPAADAAEAERVLARHEPKPPLAQLGLAEHPLEADAALDGRVCGALCELRREAAAARSVRRGGGRGAGRQHVLVAHLWRRSSTMARREGCCVCVCVCVLSECVHAGCAWSPVGGVGRPLAQPLSCTGCGCSGRHGSRGAGAAAPSRAHDALAPHAPMRAPARVTHRDATPGAVPLQSRNVAHSRHHSGPSRPHACDRKHESDEDGSYRATTQPAGNVLARQQTQRTCTRGPPPPPPTHTTSATRGVCVCVRVCVFGREPHSRVWLSTTHAGRPVTRHSTVEAAHTQMVHGQPPRVCAAVWR